MSTNKFKERISSAKYNCIRSIGYDILNSVWNEHFDQPFEMNDQIRCNPNVLFDEFEKVREIMVDRYTEANSTSNDDDSSQNITPRKIIKINEESK